jgi:hypothetical protein
MTNGVSHSWSINSSSSPETIGAALTSSLAPSAMNSLLHAAVVVGIVVKAFEDEITINAIAIRK